MVRISCLTVLLSSSVPTYGQELFDRAHYLCAQSSIAVGIPTHANAGINVYLHGDLEYYFDQHTSVRSESYVLMTGNELSKQKKYFMISSFTGISYHPAKSRVDPYFCFQPGVSIYTYRPTVVEGQEGSNATTQLSPLVQPQVSLLAGVNLFVNRFIHFFIACRYVTGLGNSSEITRNYNDIRISGGLGWNVCLKKSS